MKYHLRNLEGKIPYDIHGPVFFIAGGLIILFTASRYDIITNSLLSKNNPLTRRGQAYPENYCSMKRLAACCGGVKTVMEAVVELRHT